MTTAKRKWEDAYFKLYLICGSVPRPKEENYDYRTHREECRKGKFRRRYAGTVSRFGDRTISCCLTPEGLKGIWEATYIERIRAGERGIRFEREIRTSPLPRQVKENLLLNMRRRRR